MSDISSYSRTDKLLASKDLDLTLRNTYRLHRQASDDFVLPALRSKMSTLVSAAIESLTAVCIIAFFPMSLDNERPSTETMIQTATIISSGSGNLMHRMTDGF